MKKRRKRVIDDYGVIYRVLMELKMLFAKEMITLYGCSGKSNALYLLIILISLNKKVDLINFD